MVVTLLVNLFTFKPLGYYGSRWGALPANKSEWPFVSILIPARNEAGNIARCVRSLLSQSYANFEIIVLDDNSEDSTSAIVEMLAIPGDDPHRRLRLVKGAPLPKNWLGKNFACHQLSQYAQGDLLLFTDADTFHSVSTLSKAVTALLYEKADFLSVFPRQQTVSLAERLSLPMLPFFVVGLLPIWFVSHSPRPTFSAANGQFMLFRRETYEAIGGHAAVREIVLEDVTMGRLVKKLGFKQILPDGSDLVQCRMYRGSGEVWRGFSKNIFAFFDFKIIWFSLFMGLNLAAFVGPYLWLLLALLTLQPFSLEWYGLPLLQIGLAWFIRLVLAIRFEFRLADAFLHPLSVIYMFIIGINSVKWSRGVSEWKGRKFSRNPKV